MYCDICVLCNTGSVLKHTARGLHDVTRDRKGRSRARAGGGGQGGRGSDLFVLVLDFFFFLVQVEKISHPYLPSRVKPC